MSTVDLSGTRWRKSSFSGSNEYSSCVEVAFLERAVAVRDSKDPAAGALLLSAAAWRSALDEFVQ
ncbi:DUF397 domain-containing protein [Amycolatopsis nigrescens]|uniref:DUF397 domain-containing protein n=1 Tax=Amycolatopsis nigrescens TaxID=381445 RepID=UPI00036C5AF0|nr:DUF397 domain-containing protein [Amycolatopsis nigrescens]